MVLAKNIEQKIFSHFALSKKGKRAPLCRIYPINLCFPPWSWTQITFSSTSSPLSLAFLRFPSIQFQWFWRLSIPTYLAVEASLLRIVTLESWRGWFLSDTTSHSSACPEDMLVHVHILQNIYLPRIKEHRKPRSFGRGLKTSHKLYISIPYKEEWVAQKSPCVIEVSCSQWNHLCNLKCCLIVEIDSQQENHAVFKLW